MASILHDVPIRASRSEVFRALSNLAVAFLTLISAASGFGQETSAAENPRHDGFVAATGVFSFYSPRPQ